jgi:type IV pilus assembly protein PilO
MNIKGGNNETRIAVVVFLITAVLVFFWYSSFYSKKSASLAELQQEYERLESEYQNAKALAANLEQLQANYEQVKAKWVLLRQKVPMNKELTSFLDDVKANAKDCGVQIKKIRLQPKMLYADWERHQYQFDLVGGYHGIGKFISEITKTNRIITVEYVELLGMTNIYEDPAKVSAVMILAISQFSKEPEGFTEAPAEPPKAAPPETQAAPEQGGKL